VAAPQFWLIAGANGSGKTTVASKPEFRGILAVEEMLNPDEITREIQLRHPRLDIDHANRHAADETEVRVKLAILQRRSFAVETVLSTLKYLLYALRAQAMGYVVSMVYVAVRTPDVAVQRVAFRVQAGGHDVPVEKIRSRWVRSHEILGAFVPHLDSLFVFDNTEENAELVARKTKSRVEILAPGRLPKIDEVLSPGSK
jgi:predicted ABC-type ATPase